MIEYGTPPGTKIRLKEKPDGYLSQHAALTVGRDYLLKGFNGSCIIISTDDTDNDAHIWRGRADISPLTPR